MDLGELVEAVRCADGGDADNYAPMLICYGGWVGTDLPGEKWLVIGSAPKTPISVVCEAQQARGRIRSAGADDEEVTLDRLQLAQGLGRALRTPEDTCCLMWPANGAFSELGLSPVTGRLQ